MRTISPVINAQICAHSPHTVPIVDVYTNREVGTLHLTDEDLLARMVAQIPEPDMSFAARRSVIRDAAAILADCSEMIARSTSQEVGSPIRFTSSQLEDMIGFMRQIHKQQPDLKDDCLLMPKGTILMVSASNEPIALAVVPMVSALLWGNRVLFKPATATPTASFYVVRALLEAGWPAPMIQYVPLRRQQLKMILGFSQVHCVHWMGSYESLRRVGATAVSKGKELYPECQGNDWCLVGADFDVETAADIIIRGFTANNGLCCQSIRGVLVEADAHAVLLRALCERLDDIRVGDPLKPDTEVGPLNPSTLTHMKRAVEQLRACSDDIYGYHVQGRLFHPTVVLNPDAECELLYRGFSGPLAWIKTVPALEETLTYYARNPYRISSTVLCHRKETIQFLSRELPVARININRDPMDVSPFEPWGGCGLSGYGGARSWASKFQNTKYIARGDN